MWQGSVHVLRARACSCSVLASATAAAAAAAAVSSAAAAAAAAAVPTATPVAAAEYLYCNAPGFVAGSESVVLPGPKVLGDMEMARVGLCIGCVASG